MKEFYSRREAATILKVTVHTISKYIREEKLRSIKKSNRHLIPCEDVHYLYGNFNRSAIPSVNDIERLEKMIASLREEVNVLKIGIGYGAPVKNRTDDQLLLIRQEVLQELSKSSWSAAKIFKMSDIMLSLNEKDISRMVALRGAEAWRPIFDIVERMHKYIKSIDTYPMNGLDTLEARLVGAKNRVYGLIYVATKLKTDLPKSQARQLEIAKLKLPPIDNFIAKYIKARLTMGER